ncbi:MAG TPA: NAD-dependent epimerase/dehydratase family protein [Thermomicrobiales bacterium]|nr:NAD-dependent epimerase/dehydratase family protein [Thermomicrobiales bacterium]
MKILVTGGAGFIGSNVVDAYIEAGHQVLVADDLSAGKRENVDPAATLHEVDIATPAFAELVAAERPDIINHHAAQTSVRHSVGNPLDDCRRNILGSLNVIEAARQAGVGKLIYISSGGAIYGEPSTLPCPEDHPVVPDSPYGASKHAPEHYLDIYRRVHGLNYTVLRYGNVYGPRQDPYGEAGVIAIFTAQMLAGQQVTINGSGEQERDFVFVGDVVRANLRALETGDGEAFNIGNGEGTTINQIFGLLRDATGSPHDAAYGPAKAGETFRIYLDISKAAQGLGWRPEVNLRDGLIQTVASLRTD